MSRNVKKNYALGYTLNVRGIKVNSLFMSFEARNFNRKELKFSVTAFKLDYLT